MRDLTSAFLDELTKPIIRLAYFCQLQMLDGSVLSMWTGYDYITWNSVVWIPLGYFADVSDIPESSDLKAEGINLTLNGIPASLLAEAQNNLRQGQRCLVLFGLLDANGAVIDFPYASFDGLVDTVSTDQSRDKFDIHISAEDQMIRLQKPILYTFTDGDQKYFYPGDNGFNFIQQMQAVVLSWGSSSGVPQLQPVSSPKPGNTP